MRRLTSFDRDFRDLHGRGPEIVTPMPVGNGARLVLGVLGLFWALVLGGVVLAVVGFAIYALVT